MQLIRGFQSSVFEAPNVVATIGNFDGVHLGHQALLLAVKTKAQKENLPSMVVIFEPQPEEYFRPHQAPPRLTSFKEKWRILEKGGIDYVCCLKFNAALANMSAYDFAHRLLFETLNIQHLFIGKDFRFGHARNGDVPQLQAWAKTNQRSVNSFEDVLQAQQRISSTQIRMCIQAHELKQAAKLLGRPYSMYGKVVYGEQVGRTFGIPTANILVKRTDLPATGVFGVLVQRSCGTVYQGVANLGKRPTVHGHHYSLEVHLFDFAGPLYGEYLEVAFLHYIRAEQKYPSLDALIAQIQQDVRHAREIMPTIIEEFPIRVVEHDQRKEHSV